MESNLHVPRRVAANSCHEAELTVCHILHVGIGVVVVMAVKSVEEFATELNLDPFTDIEGFVGRHVLIGPTEAMKAGNVGA